ncbi:MAG: hypothetical protein WC889_10255 [Myxococcota bacterium]|jgi:hypothetical protein
MQMFSKGLVAAPVALLLLAGAAAAQQEKEEVQVEGVAKAGDAAAEAKKPGVFELVNRMLEVKVDVRAKNLTREISEDMAGKVEGALKDCFVQQIKGNEKYRVKDDRLYRSRYVLGVKVDKGLFKKVSVDSSTGASPVVRVCIKPLSGLETGYGDYTGSATVTIDTRLR